MGARRLPVAVLAHAVLTIVSGSDISPVDAAEVARAAVAQAEAGAGDKGAPASEDAPDEDDTLPDEVTASVSLVSDYVDRGISNTGHNPALQGGITYALPIGLHLEPYAGFWGSSVDFDDGDEATIEIDWMFGFTGSFDGLEWDLGVVYYQYPGADSVLDYDYWEIPLILSVPIDSRLLWTCGYYFSAQFSGGSGVAHYLQGGLKWAAPVGKVTFGAEAVTGHQWIERNARYGTENYQDWRIGISLTFTSLTAGIAYTDTDLGRRDCFGGTNSCQPRVLFTIGAQF